MPLTTSSRSSSAQSWIPRSFMTPGRHGFPSNTDLAIAPRVTWSAVRSAFTWEVSEETKKVCRCGWNPLQ
jgi:hypothetical protein